MGVIRLTSWSERKVRVRASIRIISIHLCVHLTPDIHIPTHPASYLHPSVRVHLTPETHIRTHPAEFIRPAPARGDLRGDRLGSIPGQAPAHRCSLLRIFPRRRRPWETGKGLGTGLLLCRTQSIKPIDRSINHPNQPPTLRNQPPNPPPNHQNPYLTTHRTSITWGTTAPTSLPRPATSSGRTSTTTASTPPGSTTGGSTRPRPRRSSRGAFLINEFVMAVWCGR